MTLSYREAGYGKAAVIVMKKYM